MIRGKEMNMKPHHWGTPTQTILCKPQNFYSIKRIHTNLKYLDIPPILPVGSKKRAIQSDFLKPNMLLGDYVTGLW